MPTTPDRPDGRSAGPEDEFEAAEAVRRDARETVAIGRDRRTERIDPHHQTRSAHHADAGSRETVLLDPETQRATVKVPGQRKPPDRGKRAPLLVAAGFAALWAALISYLPVMAVVGLARTLEGAGGFSGAATAGLAGWLLGHGVPIGTSIGTLGLAPLLLTLLAAWRLNRAGLHVTRAIGARRSGSVRAAALVAGTVGLWYAAFGVLAALIVDGPGTEVAAWRAAFEFFTLGVLASLFGALRSTNALVTVARRIPRALRHGVRTGVVAAFLVLSAGAVFTGLSVAVGGGQAADMIAAYRTGAAGQAGITLLSLAYGANAVIWAAAFLLGPGFALGAGSVVRVTEVTVGPLPTLPLLAGLPNGPIGAAGAALLAVPVLIGMVAGALMTRRLMRPRPAGRGEPPAPVRPPPWSTVLSAAMLAGPTAGLVLGVLAGLSSGSLGNGRLSEIGPVWWQVALVATAVVAVSASIGAATARAFRAPTG